jgi:hypothetical protein
MEFMRLILLDWSLVHFPVFHDPIYSGEVISFQIGYQIDLKPNTSHNENEHYVTKCPCRLSEYGHFFA